MLKTYDSAVIYGTGNGVVNEIFIPLTDLSTGFTLDDAEPKKNTARGLLAFLTKVSSVMSPPTFLKLGQTVNAIAGSGSGLLHNFTFSNSTALYNSSNPADNIHYSSVLPGNDTYLLTDIFPNAVKVAANGTISTAGISFVVADLEEYGSGNFAAINLANDARQLMYAIFANLVNSLIVRTTSVTSAVIAASLSTPNNFVIASSSLTANGGNIDILDSQLDNVSASIRSTTITIQTQLNTSTNTYDVLVA
jgi:hypothetical protein